MEFFGKLFGHSKETTPVKPIVLTDEMRKKTDAQLVTAELLEEFARQEGPPGLGKKFVRQGNRVLLASFGEHAYIAQIGNMQTPDDAGRINRSKQQGRLIVGGDSVSLRIESGNPNRPETIKVLRKIAPGIEIFDQLDPELYKK